jgi:hypothetical protein
MRRSENIETELFKISESISHIPFSNPYSVPEGYFDTLSEYVISAISQKSHIQSEAAEEIQQLSPLLAGLRNKPTYNAGEEYLALQVENLSKISVQQQVKSMPVRRNPYFLKLAVAASFIGIIGVSLILFNRIYADNEMVNLSDKVSMDEQLKNQLTAIETEQIIAYLEQYSLPSDRNVMEQLIDPDNLPEEIHYFDDNSIEEWQYHSQESEIN